MRDWSARTDEGVLDPDTSVVGYRVDALDLSNSTAKWMSRVTSDVEVSSRELAFYLAPCGRYAVRVLVNTSRGLAHPDYNLGIRHAKVQTACPTEGASTSPSPGIIPSVITGVVVLAVVVVALLGILWLRRKKQRPVQVPVTMPITHPDLQEMETIRKNVEGCWELGPKYFRKILNIECRDKQPNHSYKEYIQIKHSNFSEGNWKRLCPNWRYREIFQDKTSSDDMDTTEVFALFCAIFQTKYEENDCKELKTKLEAVKDIRNEMAHEGSAMKNPSKLPELHSKLLELIQVAGKFYQLSKREVKAMEVELRSDISRGFSPSDLKQTYFSHCLCSEGKQNASRLLQNFTNDLSSGVGHLKLSADFYPPKLTLPDEDEKKFPYTQVFEATTAVAVVSGVAAAGKSTLLKNLIQQFLGLQREVPDYLKSFDLLVFIECRDDTKDKLHQVVREHFGDVCSKIGQENILPTLSCLCVLFLVDAFDEANENSMTVLRELFQKTWHRESRIIITTRPKAIEELEQFIRQSSFTHYHINPLSELAEQLEFIKGCKQNLTNDPAICAAMQDRFSKLSPEVRKLLTQPISLLQFCTIFLTSPKMIDNWHSAKDLSRDTLMLYKTVIERKLCDSHVPDKSVLINKIFKVIGKSALKYLSMNKIAFSKDEFLLFEQECHDQMTAHNAAMTIDSKVFLTLIFTVKRNFLGTTGARYSFTHKSIQEKFAALFISEELKNDKSLHEILGTTQAMKASFMDVLPYVMQDLSSCPLLFQRHWPELREVITETGLYSCEDWQNLLLQGPGLIELAKHAAKITITATDEWTVRSARNMEAVSLMLQYEQPRLINIKLPSADLAAAGFSWSGLTSLYRGQLELHLEESSVATQAQYEDLLECLNFSRCQLTELVGSISSDASVSAVASVSTAANTELSISLSAPLNLNTLQGKYKSLVVKIRPLEDSWASVFQPTRSSPCPEKQDDGFETHEPDAAEGRLPAYPPPQLWVLDAKPGSRETIARAIRTIAPLTKRLAKIRLLHCGLADDEVWQLLLHLHSDGIRSIGVGLTRFTKNPEGHLELFVADDLPDFTGTASAVQQVIAQLQSRDAGDFEAQWPELRRAMEEAGASARHWWEVLLSRPHEPALAEFAARITRKENEQFMIQSTRDLEAVALMLHYAQDTLVKVKASLEALRSPAWEQALKHHTGIMQLEILDMSLDFTPCDDVLQPLLSSSSKIKSFQGHIRTEAGIAALASAAASASIHIRVEAPLNLSALHGKYAELHVCTPVLDTAVAAAPLPALPSPVLQVLSPGAGTWEAVARTVLTFAPRCKKLLAIELWQSALSEEEERLLLLTLHEKRLKTNDAGTTRAEPHGAHRRRLRLCEDPPATHSP
ncbi:uncharacterized protein LOC108669644 [Hyalella azteca]|uniref:Uncharacterized protein LOC108669644 n=1 Tax=Hyalella azteca TaxID=294128 RepID=A0A8B7NFX8_HYAAZ|nr:uncharacterized protein LOC108669644 [Hyalella azteca]